MNRARLRSLADEDDDIITDPQLARELGASLSSSSSSSSSGGGWNPPSWESIAAVAVLGWSLYWWTWLEKRH